MENTEISWTDDTKSLWWGCTEVSPQCDNCYARTFDKRLGGDHWGAHDPRKIQPGVWDAFQKAQRKAEKASGVRSQFVMSMGDIFERDMPLVTGAGEPIEGVTTGDLRNRFFTDVVPNSPNLLFLLLTKRPQNIRRMVPPTWLENGAPDNVMFGASVGTGNQEADDKALAALVYVPGRLFLSCEPLLGPLNLSRWQQYAAIEWIIAGGESGHGARPMHPEWARKLRDYATAAGIAFHFKQWGNWLPVDQMSDEQYALVADLDPDAFGGVGRFKKPSRLLGGELFYEVGKKSAGRLLDGVEWNQFPRKEIAG